MNLESIVKFVTGIVRLRGSTTGTAIGNYLDRLKAESQIMGLDLLSNERRVQTKVRGDGLVALATDATVTVENTFGVVDRPFTFFTIVQTGAAGNTITINIAGTTNDSTSPDADATAYSKVFTVLAGEVGNEDTLTKRIITELNVDTSFRTGAFLKATKATDRNTVIIRSDKFSQSGEFWERPTAGSFTVVASGTAQVIVGFDNLVSRAVPVVINPDVDSGHRLGRFSVSGNVSIQAKELSDIFFAQATHVTYGTNLLQNGSLATPIVFQIAAGVTQKLIEGMWFSAQGNSIKWGQFFSKSGAGGLTNGIVVEVKSENVITMFDPLKTTEDFKNKWAALSLDGSNYRADFQSGADEALAILRLPNPFLLRETGAFGAGNDDYIKVYIKDNITSGLVRLDFSVKGFEKEP